MHLNSCCVVHSFPTRLGEIAAVFNDADELTMLEMLRGQSLADFLSKLHKAGKAKIARPTASSPAARTEEQLVEYLQGRRQEFSLPLRPTGTEFYQQVWREMQAIPYGRTRTYLELAQRIGRPRAVRAVGQASARNPIWVVIPCHRVIGSSGSLTGYGGGLSVKRDLLDMERSVAGTGPVTARLF